MVFATIALIVVLPLNVITQGVIEGQLTGDFDADNIAGGGPAYSIVQILITIPLITAGHVYAVMQVGRGEKPSVGSSLSNAGGVLVVLIGAVLLSTLATIAATLLLIIPGIYVGTRLLVTPQAVVAEERGPTQALSRSWDLVEDNWWRTFGIYIVLTILSGVAAVFFDLRARHEDYRPAEVTQQPPPPPSPEAP